MPSGDNKVESIAGTGPDYKPATSMEASAENSHSSQDAQWARDFTAEYTALVQPPLNPVLHATVL